MRYVSFLIVFAMSSPVFSEPSTTFRHLLTEPVSMLDWGVYRLEAALKDIEFENLDNQLHNRYSNAGYDWDRNRLEIHYALYLNKASSDVDTAKEACSRITERLRMVWGNQLPIASNIASFFEHSGFTSKNKPDDFSNEIQGSTYIEIEIFGTNKSSPPYYPYSKILICENPLMGKGVLSLEPTD